ncbi:MAG: hypothetical protein H0T43_04495, partial [Solirubrobacterales bacterium]|nr:hypothetical protein [Solirubrobacterales bacterium]
MRAVLAEGLRRARAGGRRTILAAVGVALAAAMLGTAVTVAYSLSTGFERAADRADLPDVLARFAFAERAEVDERVRALPNLAAREYRTEFTRIRLRANGERTRRGIVHAVRPGRRGYAVVEGRDMRSSAEEVVVERGVARAWDLEVGDQMRIEDLGSTRVVGIAVGPDNVAFPLASAPRVYLSAAGLERRFGGRLPVNVALLWTHDRDRVDVTLQQARATSFGIADLRFVTRDGVRVLIDRAAGIVIALLVALSLVALGAAGVMLGVAAHADVQRRLPALGVQRAIGFDRRTVAGAHAVSAGVVALPAGAA